VTEHRLIIERVTTRDCVVEHSDGSWETKPQPPRGLGWVLADSSRERHTTWRRIRLTPEEWPKVSLGGRT
jgi:hypothetical protein